MGYKKGLQKYKNIWSAKNNVTWTTKRSEKKSQQRFIVACTRKELLLLLLFCFLCEKRRQKVQEHYKFYKKIHNF